MLDTTAVFAQMQLRNRLNRPVSVGYRLVVRDGHNTLFIHSEESAARISKNFEAFAGQLVRALELDPLCTDIVELRQSGEEPRWYRWQVRWVATAPVECIAEEVSAASARRHLTALLQVQEEAAA